MSDMITLVAEDRDTFGKGPASAIRRGGRVPGVVYGEKKEQLAFTLETRALRRELQNPRFYSTLCQLEIGGKPVRVLPREIQLHPVTDQPIHADFVYVSRGATVTVEVPVVFLHEEECPGLKRGGVLNVVRREVELVCPADSIPDHLELDLAKAEIGDTLHFSEITLAGNVEPTITGRDFTIATIAAPTVEAEPEEGEEDEVAADEVEAIEQKSDDGDEAGGDSEES